MRNLKKALSLVLATAMLLSMFVISAGAVGADDLNDADEITNTEAVSVMVELGLIGGDNNGNFNPNGTLTRAEMCKLVCLAMNGGREPVIGVKDVPTFKDIDNHWAEAYIEYCYASGIIGGDGSGNFNPNGVLTGVAAAKMMLTAMNYDATIFGFGGADWELNVGVQANDAHLYDGIESISPSQPITRDNAAQLVYNAIQAKTMNISWGINPATGEYTQNYSRTGDSLLAGKFQVDVVVGVVLSTETGTVNGTLSADGKTVLDVRSINEATAPSGGSSFGPRTYNVTTDSALLGHEVKLLVKDTNAAPVYGSAIVTENNNALLITEKMTSDRALSDALADAGITSVAGAKVYTNAQGAATTLSATNSAAITALNGYLGNGKAVDVIDNDNDDTAEYVLITDKEVGKVTAYNTQDKGYIHVAGLSDAAKVVDSSDPNSATNPVIGFDTVAKDDIVLYYQNAEGNWVVEKCSSLVVTPTSVKGEEVTASGSVYKQSALNTTDVSDTTGNQASLAAALTSGGLGNEATFYFDDYGYVVYMADVTEELHYMLITGVDNVTTTGFESLRVKGVLEDGTQVTVNVAKVNGKAPGASGYTAPGKDTVVSYKVNADGNYELSSAVVASSNVSGNISKNNPAIAGGTANNDTIFVIKEGDTYTVYTGIANAPGVNTATGYAVKDSNGIVKVVFVTAGTVEGASKNSIYVLNNVPSISKDGSNNVYTYDVVLNGEITTLEVKPTASVPSVSMGLYDNVSLNGDGSINESSLSSPVTGSKATTCSGGVISDGTNTLIYNADTKVFVVDGAAKTARVGSIDEVVVISGNAAQSSTVVLVRGSSNPTDANYNIASYVYIIK